MRFPIIRMINTPLTKCTTIAQSFCRIFRFCLMANYASFIVNRPSSIRQFPLFCMVIKMSKRIHQLKIFWSIIKAIVINMVNYFCLLKWSTKDLLHNKTMFIFPFTSIRYLYLPIKALSSLYLFFASYRNSYKAEFPISFNHFYFRFFRPANRFMFWQIFKSASRSSIRKIHRSLFSTTTFASDVFYSSHEIIICLMRGNYNPLFQ